MVRQLETHSSAQLSKTVCFLWTKLFTSTEIHREILAVCRPHVVLRPAIVKWCHQIRRRSNRTDAKRQARPSTVSTSDMVQREQNIITSNRIMSY